MRTILGCIFTATLFVAGPLLNVGDAQDRPVDGMATLTDIDTLRIENRDLKRQLVASMAEAAQWQQAYGTCAGVKGQLEKAQNDAALAREDAALVKAIEAAHPGFLWDLKTRAFTRR